MPNAPSLDDCKVLGYKIRSDDRGHLVAIEVGPCTQGMLIDRIFYIFGVPRGATRGGHAAKICAQIVIALAGSVKLDLEDAMGNKDTICLDHPGFGVYIPPLIWRTLHNFAPGTVLLVLCDRHYAGNGNCETREKWKERCA